MGKNSDLPLGTSYVMVVAMQPGTSSGDGGLALKYIGAIIAGALAFSLTVALVVWSIKRHLNRVMRAVDRRLSITGDVKPPPATGDEVVGSRSRKTPLA